MTDYLVPVGFVALAVVLIWTLGYLTGLSSARAERRPMSDRMAVGE